MATTVARLQAVLDADTRQFDRAMGRSESRMKSAAKTAGKAGLAGAVIGLGFAVRAGFKEFMQAQKVTAQTNAVLKSTGGVANVSAKQVDRLANSLMLKSGVDDETIKSGENMLLTFTKIHNEAGRGNDIFNQATKATLDLSVAMGKDMQSSAILVGKALNDPLKGMTALTRAGIQFTEEQKNSIKAMVESGNTMGAQKLILKELETQFGGSAEAAGKTFGGQINIARERLNNFLGVMVERGIPILKAMVDYVQTNYPKVREVFANVFNWVRDHVFPVIRDMRDIFVASIQRMREAIDDNGPELRRILARVSEIMTEIWKVAGPALKVFFVDVLPPAIDATIKVVDAVFRALDKVEGALESMRKWVKSNGEKFLGPLVDGFREVAEWVGKVVGFLRDMIGLLGKIPSFPKIPGIGSEIGKLPTGGGGGLDAAVATGNSMGLSLTSRFRPGDPGDHGKGKAIDMAGSASAMARFASAMFGTGKDVIYGALPFWQDNGRMIQGWLGNEALRSDHFDHVHYSVFDKGGWLKPGLTLAYNGTGQSERVGGGNLTVNFPNYVGSKAELMGWLQNAAQEFKRRNGRSAF